MSLEEERHCKDELQVRTLWKWKYVFIYTRNINVNKYRSSSKTGDR